MELIPPESKPASFVDGRYCRYLDIKTKWETVEFMYGRSVHDDLYIGKCTAYYHKPSYDV
jgi:hypothetical protein